MQPGFPEYEAVIGLEVHAQLSLESKAFCADSAAYGGSPNTHISPITLAHPGTLPKLNKKAIEYAVKMGLACYSQIQQYNYFDRKSYFYPDLPKAYQITQNTTPICQGGHLNINVPEGKKNIRLHHIHLEEDAGKSLHDQHDDDTLVDFNRAGVTLIEIVSEPDLRNGDEAAAYLAEIRKLVRYLEICDGNMEKGNLRCDANISVRPKGAITLGAKVEIKNMNSIRNVKKAVEFEAARQIEAIRKGEIIVQETRSFDSDNGITLQMREKEMANDYRYFPEPDLAPFYISDEFLSTIRENIPMLPEALFIKYTTELGLSEYDAGVITDDKQMADYFEKLIQYITDYKAAANWLLGPVKSYLNEKNIDFEDLTLSCSQLAGLIQMVQADKISFSAASGKILPSLIENPQAEAPEIAISLNLIQDANTNNLFPLVEEVLAAYPDKVKQYKAGKKGLLGLFVGEVIKRSNGKANPKLTNQLLTERLEG
jgi:aspartyl-tRNA(Asn)/glutamyl-tRNA(Gln) amidotransferase subunit B